MTKTTIGEIGNVVSQVDLWKRYKEAPVKFVSLISSKYLTGIAGGGHVVEPQSQKLRQCSCIGSRFQVLTQTVRSEASVFLSSVRLYKQIDQYFGSKREI